MIVIKRRTAIKLVSFAFAVILVLIGLLIQVNARFKESNKKNEENIVLNLNQITSTLSSLNSALKKIKYIDRGSLAVSEVTNIVFACEDIITSIKNLGYDSGLAVDFFETLEQCSVQILQDIADGKTPNESLYDNIDKLGVISGQVLSNLSNAANSQQLNSNEVIKLIENTVVSSSYQEDFADIDPNGQSNDISSAEIGETLSEYAQVSKEEAFSIAETRLSLQGMLSNKGTNEDDIPSYVFGNEDINVLISKNGGFIVKYLNEYASGESLITVGQATDYADRFIYNTGYRNMVAVTYTVEENLCKFTYAYLNGATLCYTDIIKVSVALDNGTITDFDATEYLKKHTERAVPTPQKNTEEAKQSLPQQLKFISISHVLLPVRGTSVYCYELYCKNENNQHVLLYLNASTLEKEQIYILEKDQKETIIK